MVQNITQQLTGLLGRSGNVQARIQQHLSEAKNPRESALVGTSEAPSISRPLDTPEDAGYAPTDDDLDPNPAGYDPPEVEEVVSSPSPPRAAKLVYLAYSYHSIPHYVDALRKDLLAAGYLLFDPLEDVEHQFDEEHREPLLALKSRVPDPLVNTLRLSPLVQREVSDPSVIPLLRRGDTRSEVDSMIFKELFFLVRSSIVLCDLVLEPHACELFQKIFYAKMLDIPVIGISPIGRGVSAYVQKYLKVLLTDDFNTQNILPLVKAYTS